MKLRFAHLCDYATPGANDKLIIVGIFDVIYSGGGSTPIGLPPCYLIALIDADFIEGLNHTTQVRVVNEDGKVVIDPVSLPSKFVPIGPGRPLACRIMMQIPNMALPEVGDYNFEFLVDGKHVGELPLYISEAP